MQLSDTGLKLITSFEGYHKKINPNDPHSDCIAYRCIIGKDADGEPVHDGKWTLGYGCTEGVTEGMVWTHAQALERRRAELAVHEEAVNRMLTVAPTQNQFDALVSISYNAGAHALETSTLLRKFNSGDAEAAAEEFPKWKYSKGLVVPGLVTRRAAERALFLTPPVVDAPWMPQTVDTPAPPPARQAHQAADQQLADESPLYALRRLFLRNAQPLTFAALSTGAASRLPEIKIPDLSEIERIGTFLQSNGWKWSLVALIVAVALETVQAAQRAPIVKEAQA